MYTPLDSPKYNKWKHQLLQIIQLAPEKYYLAQFLQPYLSYVNDSHLTHLYNCLEDIHITPGKYTIAIKTVVENSDQNPRVIEVLQKMIDKFYY